MRFIIILSFLIMGARGLAQDPELLREWFLQEVNIDGTSYFRPSANFRAAANFQVDFMEVFHPSCKEGFGTDVSYSNPNIFNLVDSSVVLLGICLDPDIILFMERHYTLYLLDNIFARNPFTYSITTGSNGLTLTVTNGSGDYGIYGDQLLSTATFTNSNIKIYPNPVDNFLYIENRNTVGVKTISVYDLAGRLVIERTDDVTQIDMTNLNSGLFLLKIESESHTQYEKIVKH